MVQSIFTSPTVLTFFFWSSNITGLVQIKLCLFANWRMDRLYMSKQCMPSLLKSTADSYKLWIQSIITAVSVVADLTEHHNGCACGCWFNITLSVSVVADLTEHHNGCVCGCWFNRASHWLCLTGFGCWFNITLSVSVVADLTEHHTGCVSLALVADLTEHHTGCVSLALVADLTEHHTGCGCWFNSVLWLLI